MVDAMKKEFSQHDMDFVIGGQISIDCFPKGWDKRYCLQHIKGENITNIIFFGDMTQPGSNDHEIYKHESVTGITAKGPEETLKQVNEELKKLGISQINI